MKNPRVRFTIPLLATILFTTWFYWPELLPNELSDLEKRGQYGDSFGALNTLFTGLALVGVAYSVYLQLQERKKRDQERYEDAFESRIFRFSDSIRALISAMNCERNKQVKKGKDAFEGFYSLIGDCTPATSTAEAEPRDVLLRKYRTVYSEKQDDLGPYFRILYHTFRYIDRSRTATQKEYSDIIRAELSTAELSLLAVNGLTQMGQKFKPLIEKYHLLKHLPKKISIDPHNVIQLEYAASAFEE
jgi:hypothetical protein